MPLYDARQGSDCRGSGAGWQFPDARILPMIEVVINGNPENFAAPVSVAGLLADRGLTGKRVAVEQNGEIVPKSRHAETLLAAGDRIEIVVAVGGG